MPANSFKSDDSFLEKLAVGATGTNATMRRLQELGYQPIELERGSTGYKIWKKVKIKRIRVPDILDLKSGQRVESRGKTKLEISMSHSLRDPHRAWDYGMRPDDLVAFLLCEKKDDTPVNWTVSSPVHFVKVQEMRDAFEHGHIRITKPKGVEEGSEIRVIWPGTIANDVSEVSEVSEKSIKLSPVNGQRPQRVSLSRKNYSLLSQVKLGDKVQKNQIVASTVPIYLNPVCKSTVDEGFFREQLHSVSLSERYAAAKALRFRSFQVSGEVLLERMIDQFEDLYVKLEAAAALAAHDDPKGWEFLSEIINSQYLEVQLETVIVLSEIHKEPSERILISVLTDRDRDTEIRAGAAWGLGEFRTLEVAKALINTFNLSNTEIKIEAARALLKLGTPQLQYLVEVLETIEPSKRDGIAWTLARVGGFNLTELVGDSANNDLRQWVSYIAGFGKSNFNEDQIAALCAADPEVYFAASVLWKVLESWIYNLGEY